MQGFDPTQLERRTRELGSALFAHIEAPRPVPFGLAWWDDRLMDWTMRDEAVKVQLFRFIDVLPQLRSPGDVMRHLREYFEDPQSRVPAWLRRLARLLPQGGPVAALVADQAQRGARRMARRFIAGANVQEALEAIRAMRRRQLAFTIDLLGEATITEKEAEETEAEILELLDGLCAEVNAWPEAALIDRDADGPLPRVNVSVKLSSLFSQFDPMDPAGTSEAVRARLRPIFRRAQLYGAFINVDMEQHSFKDETLRIFCDLLCEDEFRAWGNVGIAIQAYLRSCMADLERLLQWVQRRGTPVWVRLIKGAYWDYETVVSAQEGWPLPIFSRKWETDANYETCSRFLLEQHRWLKPAFGSHNVRSLAHAMAAAELLGLPDSAYEIQMLYGMGDPIKHALVKMGRRVRVYTPFGELLPGMAYLVRRLLENTANTSFLRASFADRASEDQLLRNPARLV